MAGTGFDPLAGRRAAADPACDVLLWGTVFLDIIFTGLPHLPAAGTEVWADGMGSSPGGIANLAVASSRLGLRTSLAAAFGDDVRNPDAGLVRTYLDERQLDATFAMGRLQ